MNIRQNSLGWVLGRTLPFCLAVAMLNLLGLDSLLAADAAKGEAGSSNAQGSVPLIIKYPPPGFKGTPKDLKIPGVEPAPQKPPPPLMVPAGVKNIARTAKITCSDKNADAAMLAQIVDGDKTANDESIIYLRKGTQWVQMDFGSPQNIYAIVIWHAHNSQKVYHDVVVQASDDPDFLKNVKTVFNNDQDNSSGLGVGTDREYFETRFGKLINANGVTARYLRFYSKGSTESALNEYTEIEVYGKPASTAASDAPAPKVETAAAAARDPQGLVPLLLKLPPPGTPGTPPDIKKIAPDAAPPRTKPRPPLMVPPGLVNLAPAARITSSDPNAIPAMLAQIVDGDKSASDNSIIYLRKGTQWVQMDFGAPKQIFAIVIWHAHDSLKVYHDVVVQASNDPDFTQNVNTLFNNDQDNSSGLGVGTDREYFETRFGKLIDTKGTVARYLRFYSRGSTESALNEYTEIEVYGRPAAKM